VITAGNDGIAKIWELSFESRTSEDLVRQAELLASHRIDQSAGVVPLSGTEIREDYTILSSKFPRDFQSTPEDLLAWHRREAMDCEWRQRWSDAVRHLDYVISAQPARWIERETRARFFVEMKQWDKAAADFAEAVALGSQDWEVWYSTGLVKLMARDEDGHRRVCSLMLERLGRGDHPAAAYFWTARTCILSPSAVPNWEPVVKAAERCALIVPRNSKALATLGGALYRARRFSLAEERISQALKGHDVGKVPETGGACLLKPLLAMIHHQLAHASEARLWLNKATAQASEIKRDRSEEYTMNRVLPGWNEQLELELLIREAERLVK
jgi:tetratricopeptide (TPR) repeat protein